MRKFFNQTSGLVLRKETRNENGLSVYSDYETFSGYLKPMSRQESAINGAQHGKQHLLLVPLHINILKGDKVYNAEADMTLSVQSMTVHNKQSGSMAYKECILYES